MHESGVRLPDIEARFVRQACGKRSADNEVGLQLEPAAGALMRYR